MFNFDFDYDLINILFFLIVYFVGRKVAKGYPYWKCVIWVIVMFVFVEGARYGRGVDYLHYIDVYEYDLEESQITFTWLNKVLKALGFTAIYAFGVYAIPFIIGGAILLEKMKPYAAYMFPLFVISYISFHETFIRQALATSFYFLYLVCLFNVLRSIEIGSQNKKAFFLLVITAFLAVSIHSIQIVAIVIASAVVIFVRKPIHWIFTVPLLLFGKFFVATHFDWSYLNSLFTILSGEEKLAMYTENANHWFSDDAFKDAYTRNLIIQYLETWGNCALLYLGYKVCDYLQVNQNNREQQSATKSFNLYIAIFNIVVVGVILYQTFYNLEIVRRVAYCWYLLWFVPLSVILYSSKKLNIFSSFDKFLMLGFLFWIWQYIRFLFVFEEEPLFIWDL